MVNDVLPQMLCCRCIIFKVGSEVSSYESNKYWFQQYKSSKIIADHDHFNYLKTVDIVDLHSRPDDDCSMAVETVGINFSLFE